MNQIPKLLTNKGSKTTRGEHIKMFDFDMRKSSPKLAERLNIKL